MQNIMRAVNGDNDAGTSAHPVLTNEGGGNMPNMSYCRFENTLNDLEDCFEVMCDPSFSYDNLSGSEKEGYDKLLKLCKDISIDFCDCVEDD